MVTVAQETFAMLHGIEDSLSRIDERGKSMDKKIKSIYLFVSIATLIFLIYFFFSLCGLFSLVG